MRHEVVVIGSGLGGLLCAAILARQGKSVVVLERQTQPGGCMQSYTRGKYAFDTGLHYVGGLAEGQRLHAIFSYVGLMDLPWHRMDADGFDLITVGGQTYAFAQGYQQFADTLARQFPAERAALGRYVEMLRQNEEATLGSEETFRFFGMNAYQYLTDTFQNNELVNILAGSAIKMELRKESLPLFSFAHGNSAFIQSSWRLRAPGNLLVQRLIDRIQADGGRVVCGAEVVELMADPDVNRKRVVAARCSNGEVYGGDVFISDAHPAMTFQWVKDPHLIKNVFRRRMGMMQNTGGMLTVSMVLKPHTLRYFNHNKFVYRTTDIWGSEMQGRAGDEHSIDRVMVCCRPPQAGDYTEQVDLLTPMSWECCRKWEHTTVAHRGDDYLDMKEQKAQECIHLAETVIPGLGDMAVAKYVSTPLTYRDYNQTPEGSAYGIRKDYDNMVMTMLSPKTPIQNLLLTGQNLMLHGVEGVSMTALLTCSELLGMDTIRQVIPARI